MNFFKRLGALIYMLMMLGAGAIALAVSLNVLTVERWTETFKIINETSSYQITLTVIGGLFVLIGIIAPFRLHKRLKGSRVVAFQNPDGEVTVSLAAIEEYIRKIAKGIPGIKDVRPRVDISKKGIDVIIRVSLSSGANIPEVTERLQLEVRNKVQNMLGVEEKINVRLHINRFIKGAQQEGGAEDSPGTAHVPFREID
ncbi:alkaline shock response membrane anchor protein AmaP [Candidatus Omnitrophota bacterium]